MKEDLIEPGTKDVLGSGYNHDVDEIRDSEYPMLQGTMQIASKAVKHLD